MTYISWNDQKEKYVRELKFIFGDWLTPYEMKAVEIDGLLAAMNRWYLSLPKYTKEIFSRKNSQKINETPRKLLDLFTQNLSSQEIIFEKN